MGTEWAGVGRECSGGGLCWGEYEGGRGGDRDAEGKSRVAEGGRKSRRQGMIEKED